MEDRELRGDAERRLLARRGLLGAAFLVALLPLGARSEDAPADWSQHHRRAVEDFTEADANRNGAVESAEASELAPEAFQAADRNRDGKLGLVEWVDARFEAIGAPAAGARPEENAQPAGP